MGGCVHRCRGASRQARSGTGVDDNDRPVEIQAYWTPDPRRVQVDDQHDRQILATLTPDATSHPQLKIELALDILGGDGPSAYWDAVLGAALVSVDHPSPAGREPARDDCSRRRTDVETSPRAAPDAAEKTAVDDDEGHLDSEYEPPTHQRPGRVAAGDLILVDEALDLWGVVVSDSETDETTDSMVSIEWRTEEDDGGWLDVPDDTPVTIRHPHLEGLN